MEPKKAYIYLIRNKLTNMIYIGASKGGKKKPYWSNSKYVKADIKKLGLDNFEKTILNTYSTLEEAYEAEGRLVDETFVEQSYTYNKMPAAYQKGFTAKTGKFAVEARKSKEKNNEDFRKHMQTSRSNAGKKGGAANAGKSKSSAHKENLSKALKGRVIDDEWKNKMKEAQKQRWLKQKNDPTFTPKAKGKCWINKNGETKMIYPNELPTYLNDGWSKGRKVCHH
tara:strand:- start:12800 stop:13474 length:675 start_codon:yes stop_codon:yes gene_type:complete